MLEIERKFLVSSEGYKETAIKTVRITQGFLNTDPERTVRVRIKEDKGYIAVKGKTNASGLTRFEWEKEIPHEEATELMKLCEAFVIDKIRYEVPFINHLFEVDVFLGDNEGLVVAEVELISEAEKFSKPKWLGGEVTGDIKYYNSQLSKNPYKNW
ncbi:CYTH domain-containing protein [Leptobacterium sp. I13]|uniref:CYTH domain-containing protein n=1 Tax=Leptobacterium meishanense TaxID=3128904 RepID=UPI0030EC2EEA